MATWPMIEKMIQVMIINPIGACSRFAKLANSILVILTNQANVTLEATVFTNVIEVNEKKIWSVLVFSPDVQNYGENSQKLPRVIAKGTSWAPPY